VFHQVVFASLMLLTIIRTVYLLRMSGPSKDIPVQVRSIIVKIYWTGTGIFLLGFFVWNLDNIFCDTLTTWKFAVGWPIAFLLEGSYRVHHFRHRAEHFNHRSLLVALFYGKLSSKVVWFIIRLSIPGSWRILDDAWNYMCVSSLRSMCYH
jgi:hypothetical protein